MWIDRLIEASFKRVPEGWVFRAPSPWGFGAREHYLLNDEQKANIAANIVWRVSGTMMVPVAVVIVLGLALFEIVLGGGEFPFAAFLVLGILGGLATDAWLYRVLRPLTEGLPRTAHRITFANRFAARAATIPAAVALVYAALCLAGLAYFARSALALSETSPWRSLDESVAAAVFLAGAVYFLALLARKWVTPFA